MPMSQQGHLTCLTNQVRTVQTVEATSVKRSDVPKGAFSGDPALASKLFCFKRRGLSGGGRVEKGKSELLFFGPLAKESAVVLTTTDCFEGQVV